MNIDVLFCAQEKPREIIISSGITKIICSTTFLKKGCRKWIPLLFTKMVKEVTPQNPIIFKPYLRTETKRIKKWGDFYKKTIK